MALQTLMTGLAFPLLLASARSGVRTGARTGRVVVVVS
jgi:hypothetical protein